MEQSGSRAGFRRLGVFVFMTLVAASLSSCGGGGGGGGGGPPITTPPWTKQMGVAGAGTSGNGIATDASGNIFIAGSTDGGLDGNTRSGTTDFFLTKYNANGTKAYTRQLGVTGLFTTIAHSVATDFSGNVYVAGETNGGLDGNTLSGTKDFFLTKYSAAGNLVFTKQLGGATGTTTVARGVATDTAGNVYVTGETDANLDGNTKAGTLDLFLTKYASDGTKLFTKQLGTTGVFASARGVATDASNNVFITGRVVNGGFDGQAYMGSIDLFLTKYDSSGNKLYTKQLGVSGSYSTYAYGVATDPSGSVYVTGYTDGGLDGNASTGGRDFFFTKYNTDGTKLYTNQMGVVGADSEANAVATDSSGNVYVSGYTSGGLDGNTLTGTTDFFLTKYDSAGTRLYTKQMGVAGVRTSASGVATDSNNNVYVGGGTEGGLDGNTLTGGYDFFIVKYNSAGTKQ